MHTVELLSENLLPIKQLENFFTLELVYEWGSHPIFMSNIVHINWTLMNIAACTKSLWEAMSGDGACNQSEMAFR